MLKILHSACYQPGQLHTRWAPSSRLIIPEVESAIEVAWQKALAVPGVRLYDGPVCRFEKMQVENGHLTIDISQTTYRICLGTNFCNPHFADQYGIGVLGYSVGVSCGLITRDNYMMMGRRNGTVAYYPYRVHPFAGSLEVTPEVDLFGNVRRELREELGLQDSDITELVCHGIAEDSALRHPETIHSARTRFDRAEIQSMLDAAEHDEVWSARSEPDNIRQILDTDTSLTPIARAVLIMWGKYLFGEKWFEQVSHHID